MQEVPKDLGQRIVEAARLAAQLHLQSNPQAAEGSDGVINQRGGAPATVDADQPAAVTPGDEDIVVTVRPTLRYRRKRMTPARIIREAA
jgi:hypothetical protein